MRHLDEKADQHNFQSRFDICGSISKSGIEILLIFVIGLQQVMKLCAPYVAHPFF